MDANSGKCGTVKERTEDNGISKKYACALMIRVVQIGPKKPTGVLLDYP